MVVELSPAAVQSLSMRIEQDGRVTIPMPPMPAQGAQCDVPPLTLVIGALSIAGRVAYTAYFQEHPEVISAPYAATLLDCLWGLPLDALMQVQAYVEAQNGPDR